MKRAFIKILYEIVVEKRQTYYHNLYYYTKNDVDEAYNYKLEYFKKV